MEESYVAFGLEIQTAVALPGMRPAADAALPRLRLELGDRPTIEREWSGAAPGASWRGRLGDGSELTVESGVAGDLRLANAERACFWLAPDRRRLLCAPRDHAGIDWRRLLLSRVLPNVSLAFERQALHASAVATPRGVVAFVGRSGAGKSTLAAAMIAAGALHFSDDVLIIAGDTAYPGSPHLTLSRRDAAARMIGRSLGDDGDELWLAVDAAADGPRPVAAVVLVERRPGVELGVDRLPASPLTPAPFMLGLPGEQGGEARRFSVYSDLVETAALLRLRAEPGRTPEELVEALEASLVDVMRRDPIAVGAA